MAVTCEGICRMGTDGTCCMIFSSFTDTVHMQLSATGYRTIDSVAWPLSPSSFPVTVSSWLGAYDGYMTFPMG